MCVENKLSKEDMNLIANYINCATGRTLYTDYEEYFTPWFKAKSEYLFDIFKDGLIIDCGEIDYEMSIPEIEKDNEIILSGNFRTVKDNCRSSLIELIKEVICPDGKHTYPEDLYGKPYAFYSAEEKAEYKAYAERNNFISHIDDLFINEVLLNNRICYPMSCNFYKESKYNLSTVKDARIFRTIENLLKTIERAFPNEYSLKIEEVKEHAENLRLMISQILNTRRIKGHLKLSIHPLDYLTMSDNDFDWKSCMALFHPDERYDIGCYSAGTIATMNSPCTIVAYIEGETPFELYGAGKWSNKKWRQLVVVDEKFLVNIKGYPYYNNSLNAIILNKLKNIIKETVGWEYLENRERRSETLLTGYTIDDCQEFGYYLCTDYMYNDAECSSNLYCLSTRINEFIEESGNKWENYYYDSTPYCLICNSPIPEAGLPFCDDCSPCLRCCDCGVHLDEESVYYDENGNALCSTCYYETHRECDLCGEAISRDDNYSTIVFNPEKEEYTFASILMMMKKEENNDIQYKKFYVTDYVCPDCLKKGIKENLIAPAHYSFTDETWEDSGEAYFITEEAANDETKLGRYGIYICHILNSYLSEGWTVVNPASLAPNIDFLKNL